MAFGRNNKCVIRGTGGGTKKVMPHDEFIDRIRKTLYYGGGTSFHDMAISRPLAEYASELFSEPHKGHSLNRLSRETAGKIHANPCSLIMALIYLDRLNASDPSYVRRITPSELFIVSMMVSTKFYCGLDEEIYLSDWAKEGNMSDEKLKELELEFLNAIDWNVFVSNKLFFEKLTLIEKTLAEREGIRRGWLTYTELLNFLPSFTIGKFLLNNIAVMAVSYAASVMTIAGAFFLVSHIPGNALSRTSTDLGNQDHHHVDIRNSTEILTTSSGLNGSEEDEESNEEENILASINMIEENLKNTLDQSMTVATTGYSYGDRKINYRHSVMTAIRAKMDSFDFIFTNEETKCDNNDDGGGIESSNFTSSLFWKILWDYDKSTVRYPFNMWLKFI